MKLDKLKEFPVFLIFIFNILSVLIITTIIYLAYDAYLLSFHKNIDGLNSSEFIFFVSEGYKRILLSFGVWSFILIGMNFGCGVLIYKMRDALNND